MQISTQRPSVTVMSIGHGVADSVIANIGVSSGLPIADHIKHADTGSIFKEELQN